MIFPRHAGSMPPRERWPSGLRRRSRKPVWEQSHRGFESHPLRHPPLSHIVHPGLIGPEVPLLQLQIRPWPCDIGVWRSPLKSCVIHYICVGCFVGDVNAQARGICCGGPQCEDSGKTLRWRDPIPDGLAQRKKVLGAEAHHRRKAHRSGTGPLSCGVAGLGPTEGSGESLPGEVRRQPSGGEAGRGVACGNAHLRGSGPAAHCREPSLLEEHQAQGAVALDS